MTHYSAEMSRDLLHFLNRVEVVYTQRHFEAHDVWYGGTWVVPAGKTALFVTDTCVGRTANYGAYGKICLWRHVRAHPAENCFLFLD